MQENLDGYIVNYLEDLIKIQREFQISALSKIIQRLEQAKTAGKRIFVLGNGGSSSHANHFSCDLGKNVTPNENERFQIISMCENMASVTAYANDINYESIFSEQLKNHRLSRGDVVLAISSSGNSPNVIKACEYAAGKGAIVLGMTGFDGGKLKELSDFCLHIPCNEYEKAEDIHLIALHIIVSYFKGKSTGR